MLFCRNGYSIVMTTSLLSDVPFGYFSWAEYDIMAPVQAKNESALAAAFIFAVGLTQRQALYTLRFQGDSDLRKHVEDNPCAKFEAIFI